MWSRRRLLGLGPAFVVLALSACAPSRPIDQQAPIGPAAPVRVRGLPADAAIVFWSTRNAAKALGPSHLYVMSADGGNVTQLTFDAYSYEHVAVSHDRRHVASTRHRHPFLSPGVSSVWITDLRAMKEARLVPEFYHAGGGGVDWSPDGFVYFAAQPVKGQGFNIFRVRPDGSALTQLTRLVLNSSSVPPDPAFVGDVSVSQDGSMVAYVRGVARKLGRDWVMKPQIWVMRADGADQRLVHDGGDELGKRGDSWIGAYDPTISPDGTRVVFSQTDTAHRQFPKLIDQAHNLWVKNLDGTGLHRLTQPGSISIIPDWQEGKILYTEYNEADGYTGLVLINPDGTGKRRLEQGSGLWRGGRHGKLIPRPR